MYVFLFLKKCFGYHEFFWRLLKIQEYFAEVLCPIFGVGTPSFPPCIHPALKEPPSTVQFSPTDAANQFPAPESECSINFQFSSSPPPVRRPPPVALPAEALGTHVQTHHSLLPTNHILPNHHSQASCSLPIFPAFSAFCAFPVWFIASTKTEST